MGEYGREQRNQLSRAIANSEPRSKQLKVFVDNRTKVGAQFSLSTSVIQKQTIYRRFGNDNEAKYPRVKYNIGALPHIANGRSDITATIPGNIPLDTTTVPLGGAGVSVNTNRREAERIQGTRTMQVDDGVILGSLGFDHRGNGHRLITSTDGNYDNYLPGLGRVGWTAAP